LTLIVGPGAGRLLPGDFEVLIKVRSEDTNQTMAMIEETVPAKRLVSPHTHQNDAWVYVLTGEIGVLVGDEVPVATAGSWALKPRNVVHAMWNPGIVPARVVEVLTPGGTERWFEEITALDSNDRDGFERACVEHGIKFFPRVPVDREAPLHVRAAVTDG
jgi:quercetin dioxygenase-like cupin family protein